MKVTCEISKFLVFVSGVDMVLADPTHPTDLAVQGSSKHTE